MLTGTGSNIRMSRPRALLAALWAFLLCVAPLKSFEVSDVPTCVALNGTSFPAQGENCGGAGNEGTLRLDFSTVKPDPAEKPV